MSEEPLLTTADLARRLRVRPDTVSRWSSKGLLPRVRLPDGRWRFRWSEVEKALTASSPAK
jgi:citrate synthase